MFTVSTPSMGTAAPVGTLVVTKAADAYGVGEIVTYERTGRSYTHRIVAANADGSFITKGDLNSAEDALPVTPDLIIGRAVWIAPGLGWLFQALPWLALGGVAVYLFSLWHRFDHSWQWVVRISGWALVITAVAVWLRPWVNLVMLASGPADTGGGAMMHVVNTGLFPLDVLGTRLVSGQDTIAHVTYQDARGYFSLTPTLAFYWWQQVILYLLCLVPTGLALLIRNPDAAPPARAIEPEDGAAATAQTEVLTPSEEAALHRRRALTIGGILLAVLLSVALTVIGVTSGALTAKVTNNSNTVGTRPFFTCRNAISSKPGGNSGYLAYAMTPTTTGSWRNRSSTEADLSGASPANTGTYRNASPATTNNTACPQDSTPAVVFNGSQCLYTKTSYPRPGPSEFSLEAWFQTSTKRNGSIIMYGDRQTAVDDAKHDRKIYIDTNGRVVFGLYPGNPDRVEIVYSSATGGANGDGNYADGQWHHVIATLAPSGSLAGMRIYLDGVLAASNNSVTTAQDFAGYWKIGCGKMQSWRNAGSTSNDYDGPAYFTGNLQYVAAYPVALTAQQVQGHYLAGVD